MSRLVTFGCSYTYGHGLPDCHIESIKPGLTCSKLGWPNMLGDMLNLEVLNCSNPGASNLQILWKLLNFNFNNDDLCIIMWTHFGRQPFTKLKYDSSIVEWGNWDSKVVKNALALEEENIVVNNYITMNHGYLYLLSKNIKHHFILASNDHLIYPCPIEIPSLIKDISLKTIDYALDNKHPGLKSNLLLAETLFGKLNVIH